jgi:hypothetical protein
MNGIGIGTSVGLGCLIGLLIVDPGVAVNEVLTTIFFYGVISGLLFELYRFAFHYRRPMSGR